MGKPVRRFYGAVTLFSNPPAWISWKACPSAFRRPAASYRISSRLWRCSSCSRFSGFTLASCLWMLLLTVGKVSGMSHAIYPRESWIMYDEFMSKFCRKEDGTLMYMGEKVFA